jgi:DNA-binding phage protein
MTLDQVRESLKHRNIQAVAREVRLHPNCIYRLMRQKTNPRYETVQRIINYLQGT